jgi:hypothetical protein
VFIALTTFQIAGEDQVTQTDVSGGPRGAVLSKDLETLPNEISTPIPVLLSLSRLIFSLSFSHTKLNCVALVSKRTIPIERPLLVGEVIANFGW